MAIKKKPMRDMHTYYGSMFLLLNKINEKQFNINYNYNGIREFKGSVDALERSLKGHINTKDGNIQPEDLKALNELNNKLEGNLLDLILDKGPEELYKIINKKASELTDIMFKSKIIPPYPPEQQGVEL